MTKKEVKMLTVGSVIYHEERTGISCLTEYDLIHHYYVNIKW